MSESLFLDDKLYNHATHRNLIEASDFQAMLNELISICEKHWKPSCTPNMSNKNVKALLDRTFNSWDVFIKRMEKDKYFLIDVLRKYSYKEIFMSNDTLKSIYEKL